MSIKKDQMTPLERMTAVIEGKPFDRLPCALFADDHASKLIGAKVRGIHLDAEKLAQSQIAAYEVYGSEFAAVGPGMHGIAEVLGTVVEFPDYREPHVRVFGIRKQEDIEKLEVPNPLKAGRFPLALEAAKRVKEVLGGKVPVSVEVPGLFTTAANLRGTEELMRDIRRNPEFVHRLLRLVTDTTIAFIREAGKLGVDFGVYDPTASGDLISEKHFLQFAFPYLKELNGVMKELSGNSPSLHICGNSRKLWGHMVNSGAGILSLDNMIDLEEAKHAVGDRAILMGNVTPTGTMYLGTPEDVDREARECIRKAYDNPKGYVLALGCGLPYNTPPENIHALVNAARKYGQYPVNPELLS